MVSGGLALMKHFFRDQLTNRELVTRLFATANKDGIYATSSIYGQGFMDLGAAVSPVSTPQVTTSGRAGDDGSSIRTTALRLGPAFGDGLARSLAGREIAAFDALGDKRRRAAPFVRAPAAFGFGLRQIMPPGVFLLAGDLSINEAVDGLVRDARPMLLHGEAASHLLRRPAVLEARQDRGPARRGAVQLGARPAAGAGLVVGIARLITLGAGRIAFQFPSNA